MIRSRKNIFWSVIYYWQFPWNEIVFLYKLFFLNFWRFVNTLNKILKRNLKKANQLWSWDAKPWVFLEKNARLPSSGNFLITYCSIPAYFWVIQVGIGIVFRVVCFIAGTIGKFIYFNLLTKDPGVRDLISPGTFFLHKKIFVWSSS